MLYSAMIISYLPEIWYSSTAKDNERSNAVVYKDVEDSSMFVAGNPVQIINQKHGT